MDHLMENNEEEVIDTPVQDIPSRFPKPHVIRVIDGSLDDDIDNLVNHDGTMTHTLVDPPKNFKQRELKEINSKSPPSQNDKKDNTISKHHHQTSVFLDRMMSREGSSEGFPSSKVVPYYERNNSSKAPTIHSDDADFCHLKQSLDDGIPDLDKLDTVKVTFASEQREKGPDDFGQDLYGVEEIEGGMILLNEKKPEGLTACNVGEQVEANSKSDDVSEMENTLEIDKAEVTEIGDISGEGSAANQNIPLPSDSILQVVEQFLKTMSKEELQKRLGVGNESAGAIIKKDKEKEVKTPTGEIMRGAEAQNCEQQSNLSEKLNATTHPNLPMKETIALLKQTLEVIGNDSTESNHVTESQKTLAVTALKLAGDSMNAASKMADALTLLVQSSQAGNNPFTSQCLPLDQALVNYQRKADTTSTTLSEPSFSISDKLGQVKKINPSKQKVDSSPEKKSSKKDSESLDSSNEPRAGGQNEVATNPSSQEECEAREKQTSEGKERRTSKSKKEKDGKDHESKSSRKHRDHDDRSGRKSSERRKRESKHVDQREDHHRKRSSKRADEHWVAGDDDLIDDARSYANREEMDMQKWENAQKKHLSKDENADDILAEADHYKESSDPDGAKRRVKRRSNREEHSTKYRSVASSPQGKTKPASEIPPFKSQQMAAHNMNESHTPRVYNKDNPVGNTTMWKSLRSRRDCIDDDSSGHHLEEENFVKSAPWTLPNEYQYPVHGERYFDQVVRHLKPYSPTRDPNTPAADPNREYFRAKLVGSSVDPNVGDSDFDSIEFNANARPSESTRVHCDCDDEELYY